LIQGVFFQRSRSLGLDFGPDGTQAIIREDLNYSVFHGMFGEGEWPGEVVGTMSDRFGDSVLL